LAERVIQSAISSKYAIKKYQYKAFDKDEEQEVREFAPQQISQERAPEPVQAYAQPVAHDHRHEMSQKQIETLLGKIEELSSGMIKMEMQMEKQQADFTSRLEEDKKRAYDDGFNAATAEFDAAYKSKSDESDRALSLSVKKLDDIATSYELKLIEIEKELAKTAMSIAEQVIKKEVTENSSKIALSLVKELLSKLKEASKIKIKANKIDAAYLKKALASLSKVVVEEDDAVQKGGVIALSDIGNLDGNIYARLLKIKEDLLGDPN